MKEPFSLQQKMTELEKIEHYFSQPDMDLEMGIVKHREALQLAREILDYLKNAETTIEKIDSEVF